MLHIDIPTVAEFKALAAVRSDACVSIYVPTSPLSDHARANRIAFEDLAKDALAQLKEAKLDKRRIEPIVETFGLLAGSIQINTDDNKFRYRNTDPAEEIEGLMTPCAACWRDGKRRSSSLRTSRLQRCSAPSTPILTLSRREFPKTQGT
jgi:hypothetical protein